MLRSILRYPGGKTFAADKIIHHFPIGLTEMCSPFIGGGSIELNCAAQGIRVHAYDNFEPLVNFWHTALTTPAQLADKVASIYYPLSRERFVDVQASYGEIEGTLNRAAAFYALNRASYAGLTFSGGMDLKLTRFDKNRIEDLRSFKSPLLSVKQADFKDSILAHPDLFLYCDPPYANKEGLYGIRGDKHVDFDHVSLATMLRKRRNWIVSYNDCRLVRELYANCNIENISWAYSMRSSRKSNEVIIYP